MHDDGTSLGPGRPLRVMVVDDHDVFRSRLRRVLERQTGMEMVADARRGDEAVERAAQLRPDVVVMDVNMPGMSGVEATRGVKRVSPSSAILMLTVSREDDVVLDAILAGACGYLLKDSTLTEIVHAIRAAAAEQSHIAPAVAGTLLARLRTDPRPKPAADAAGATLSTRQREILRLVVAGCDNGEIGRSLHLSPHTIKQQVARLVDALGVDNRVQAAVLAVRLGLVTEGAERDR